MSQPQISGSLARVLADAETRAEQMGDLPVRNWQTGGWPRGAEKLSGILLKDTILRKNYYCASCPIGCGRDVAIADGPYAGVFGAGPEYETLGLLGGCCMVADLNAVRK